MWVTMAIVTPELSLNDKFTVDEGKIYLTGVQALVRLPLVQRRADLARGANTGTFISGYPGSPLGGYDLELQRRKKMLADHHVVHTMGVNEELAATAVMGSQLAQQLPEPKYDGVVGIWYGKANGFDRAMDALRQGNLAGPRRRAGRSALSGDDPTAKSSPDAGGVRDDGRGDHDADALSGRRAGGAGPRRRTACAMSAAPGLWTAIKMATPVADGSGSAFVRTDRGQPVLVTAEFDGRPYAHTPSSHLYGDSVLPLERSMVYARMEAALAYAAGERHQPDHAAGADDRSGIISAGKTYYRPASGVAGPRARRRRTAPARRAAAPAADAVSPGRDDRAEFAAGLEEILVLEDKRPFVELFVKDELYSLRRPSGQVLGKLDEDGAHSCPSTTSWTPLDRPAGRRPSGAA